LAFDGDFVWGVSGYGSYLPFFSKFAPTNGSVVASFPPPVSNPTGLTFDGRYLWLSESDGHQLLKMDPNTLSILQTINKEPYFSYDLAWGGGALWLAGFTRPDGHFLYQIDPATGNTLGVFDAPGTGAIGLACDGNSLFVSGASDGMIYVLAIPEPASLLLMVVALCTTLPRKRYPQGLHYT